MIEDQVIVAFKQSYKDEKTNEKLAIKNPKMVAELYKIIEATAKVADARARVHDNSTPPDQRRIRRRARTRSARTETPKSSPPKREKLCPDAKVNPMTFLFTALYINLPSIPSWSAQCIRSRNRKRNSSAGQKHPAVNNGMIRTFT